MDGSERAAREVRSWLLRYLSEQVWQAFRKTVGPTVEYDRRIICLAEAVLEKDDQLDEVDRLVQHFIGLVFHVGVIMDRIERDQLSGEVVELIRTANQHCVQVLRDSAKHERFSDTQYNLIDDLRLQVILTFFKKSARLDLALNLCDELWSGDCYNARQAQIRCTLSSDAVPEPKDGVGLKQDVTSFLGAVHSSLPDCLLLEFTQDMSAAGLSQSSVCKPFSPSFTVDALVKSYWRRKLLLPAAEGTAHSSIISRHSLPPGQHEAPSVRPHRKQARHTQRVAGSSSSEDDSVDTAGPVLKGTLGQVTSRFFPARNNPTDCSTDQPSRSAGKSGTSTAQLDGRAGLKQSSGSSTRRRCVSFASTGGSGPNIPLQGSPTRRRALHGSNGLRQPPKKKRQRWSDDDEERLYKGVLKFGYSKWLVIKHRQGLLHKTAVQIKDKWRNLMENQRRMEELATKFGPLTSNLAPASYDLRSSTS